MMQVGEKTTLTEANEVYHFSVSLAFIDIYLEQWRISRAAPYKGSLQCPAGCEQHWGHTGHRSRFVTIIVSFSFASLHCLVQVS
jgi:hypothetical protein